MREGCDSARLWAESMAPVFCHTTWMAPGRGNTKKLKKRRDSQTIRVFMWFLTGIAFFCPGYGGAHPGGGAVKNIMREMRAEILAQMVCSNTKQRAKKM